MDFFNSIFSPDPEVASSNSRESPPEAAENPSASSSGGGGWDLGGLVRNLASKSETVIETYRRDLVEFGSGLKKETVAIRDAATRAVHSLPVSLDAGASVAQASLESVGQAIDVIGASVWRGTAEIISHGKEALLVVDSSSSSSSSSSVLGASSSSASHVSGRRYSRFEGQVLATQSNRSTFSEEPEDAEDFNKWRSGFELADKEEEIELLLYENPNLEKFYENLVPGVVDDETFWCRYFYRVYKQKQVEDARAELVRRVISKERDEQELSWEVDGNVTDDKEVDPNEEDKKELSGGVDDNIIDDKEEDLNKEDKKEVNFGENREVGIAKENEQKGKEEEIRQVAEEEAASKSSEVLQADSLGSSAAEADNEVASTTGKSDNDESNSENSDYSVISSQSSMAEEDDIGWDEIEDLGEHDEMKLGVSSSLRRR